MLKTYGFHSFIQRPHFSQNVKNLFRANFLTPSDIAVYQVACSAAVGLVSQFRYSKLLNAHNGTETKQALMPK